MTAARVSEAANHERGLPGRHELVGQGQRIHGHGGGKVDRVVVNREARVDVAAAEALDQVGLAVAVRIAQRGDPALAVLRRDLLAAAAQRDEYVAVVAHGDVSRSIQSVGEDPGREPGWSLIPVSSAAVAAPLAGVLWDSLGSLPRPHAASATATIAISASLPVPIRSSSNVEAKVNHVTFLDDVCLAFEPQLTGLSCTLLAAPRNELVVADYFGTDEAALKVR